MDTPLDQIIATIRSAGTTRATHTRPKPVSHNTDHNTSRSNAPASAPLMFPAAKRNQARPLRSADKAAARKTADNRRARRSSLFPESGEYRPKNATPNRIIAQV